MRIGSSPTGWAEPGRPAGPPSRRAASPWPAPPSTGARARPAVRVLVVESATDTAAVALADESGPLGSLVVARGRRHTETIAPAIEALCRRTGVALPDLD